MDEVIEIPLSKKKIVLLVIAAFAFVLAGLWLVLDPERFADQLFGSTKTVIIVGVVGILFFGGTGIFVFRKLFDKKNGLVINFEGITDHSSGVSVGLIVWDDIVKIRRTAVMSTKFLLIHVKDPEKYIQKAGSKFKASVMRANMKTYGTPLSISSNTLQYDFDELEDLVYSQFSKYKN
ncbi:hypothetical protein POV27_12705 [Aureisphaera galaxeae]|uniref:STM3941 family protein n=1 Tax=Aureisphaera galaxeae TaxID=1538023 RepID=UPI00235096E3|nr:STM3941 family protein [Aureisphaera galaxeae]MDC8004915.1 hypothetical protein [Aureisphaera galaxeae]